MECVRNVTFIPIRLVRSHFACCKRFASSRSCPTIAVRRRWTALARSGYLIRDLTNPPTHCLPMPKSRGRKPKKKRARASAPKKRLDNLNATPQERPLSTQPPQEPPPLATAPRQEQP